MMPPVVNQADAMTRRSLLWKNLGGIVTRWQMTSRGGFILMPPPRKKKSSSAPSKAEKQQQPQMNPKILGIVGGVVVLAIVGYVALSQMNANHDAAQSAVNQPIARNNPTPSVEQPTTNPNLPTSLPGNPAPTTPTVPPYQAPPNQSPTNQLQANSSPVSEMNPEMVTPPSVPSDQKPPVSSGKSRPSKRSSNPLVALIKGGVGPALGMGESGGSVDATLFITLEDGQHIPVTTPEHQAYFRGELQKEQIEKLISRSRNFSIDNPTFERIGSPTGTGSSLIVAQFDVNSIQSFLATVTVKKSSGEVATATGCLIHPDGGLVVPAETLKDGVELTVEFQNQKFRTSDIVMGYSDPNSKLAILELPTHQQVPVAPIAQSTTSGIMGISLGGGASAVNVSLVSLENNKLKRQEVTAQPTTYQLLTGETSIPVPGNWLDITTSGEGALGKPLFDATGALYGYTVAPSLDNPLGIVAIGVDSIRPLTTVALTTGVKPAAPAVSPTGESIPGSTPPASVAPEETSPPPMVTPPPSGGGSKKPGMKGLVSSGASEGGGSGSAQTSPGAPNTTTPPPSISPPGGAVAPGGALTPGGVSTPAGVMPPGASEFAGGGTISPPGMPGGGFSPDQQTTDESARKVQQLLFAPSIANSKKGAELLTSIRWIQLGTLVKMNAGSTPPSSLLGRVMNTLGRQSIEKTEVNIASAEKADQAAVLLCVINYKPPVTALDPTGIAAAAAPQDIDMVFRLLAFTKDPKDPSGKSYLRVLEVEPMTIRVPSSFQEQGASRTMKEQLTNMFNKFHSGIRKAKRDLGKS